MLKLTVDDKQSIASQLECILRPSIVIDVAFDTERMCAYAAVEYHSAQRSNYLPDGHVFGLVAPIYDAEECGEWGNWGERFTVTSDAMPSETMGIAEMSRYCHCPIKILKKLSPPQNDWARQWREVCFENCRQKADEGRYPDYEALPLNQLSLF